MSKIEKLVNLCQCAKLNGRDTLARYSIENLSLIYNGIGPERWWQWARIWVTWHYSLFEPAALIHDVRFNNSDGSQAKFNASNLEFNLNCQKLIKFHYPSGGLLAKFWQHQAAKAELGLKVGSFSAWQKASNE